MERQSVNPGCPQTYGSCLSPLAQSLHGPGPSEHWYGILSFLCDSNFKMTETVLVIILSYLEQRHAW